ncbi:type 1 glutamine amidotransferase domain-containing protein [Deinococcus apachensis]|uniref:type 1 glutamine amidotransferase domain-containing protein n=1 Tax=Deinococcus apachensis TaxID=309886 RepID=UPI00037AB786|nr:type 1 glutamine amidotransferase domain-containing protein [Deinococcus apachensis]
MARELRDRRIAVLVTDGFEQVELTVPVAALRAAGAAVDIVSLRRGRIRGMNLHEPAGRVRVSRTLEEARPEDYDGLLIPGGFINPDLLRQSAAAREFTRAFDASGKPIATLCHGPWLLASAGRVGGRTLTSWPGIRDDLVHAGATWLDQEVVRDGNWVSSRGPQDLAPFARAMRDLFAGVGPLPVETAHAASSPQRDTPPRLAVSALRWLPRPSLRGAAELAALGAGVWLLGRRRPFSVAGETAKTSR